MSEYEKRQPRPGKIEQGQCLIKIKGADIKGIKRFLHRIRRKGAEYYMEYSTDKGTYSTISRDYENL